MEKTIEDNGTTWEKPWKNPWKNHGKTVEKPIEKPMEKPMEIPRWFMWPHLLLLELYILVSHLLGGMVGWWSPPAPPRAFSKVIPSSVMKNSLYRPWFPLGYIYILCIIHISIYIIYTYYIYTWNHRRIFTLTTQVVGFLTNMILYGWCDHLLHEAPPQFCFNITPSNNRYIMIYPPEMLVAKCYKLNINQRSHRLGDPFSRWTTELAWRNTVGCRGTW